MIGSLYLFLISFAVLAVLYGIGRLGDEGARMHRERDDWSAR